MTLLAQLVAVSDRIGATTARLGKVRALADYLRELPPDEVVLGVHYLSGQTPQGRSGIGYSLLQQAAGGDAPGEPSLTLIDTDRELSALAALRGRGSAEQRRHALRELFARATPAERRFLTALLVGELRQGALAGVMTDAVAAAAGLPTQQVRQAAMYASDLGTLASAALRDGAAGLARFRFELFSPVAPMLAQTAADVGEALSELPGEVAFEWKMDGARIQLHRRGHEVRIFTRTLNEVTGALPEIVEAARAFRVREFALDGEAIVFDAAGRPVPFQVTMRRFGRKLNVEELRHELPIGGYFFDCLFLDGRSLAAEPTTASVRGPRACGPREPAHAAPGYGIGASGAAVL